MTHDLSKGNLATSLTATTAHIEQYAQDSDIQQVAKEGIKHIVAERVQAAKTQAANQYRAEMFSHAQAVGNQLMGDMYGRVENTTRTPAHQARLEAYTEHLLDDFEDQTRAILDIGSKRIAEEAARPVIVPKPKKKWWER